jgi:UPF0755 protein
MKLPDVLSKILGVMIIAVSIIGGWLGMDLYAFKRNPMNLNQETVWLVPAGSSLNRIANDLANAGIIDEPRYLSFLGRWQGDAGRIHAGEYRLEPGMTPVQLLEKMVKGDVVQYSLTLVEGWNFREILQALHQHQHLKQTLEGQSHSQIMAGLDKADEHPEGRFFPDTYHFPASTTDIEFLKRAYEAMASRLEKEWQQRAENLPYQSAYEALIMASIVEKETAVPSERDAIAGVFVRRLQKRMRLQTDPTVIYGLGEQFDGDIRWRDLRRDTPYNTYTQHGLPPTPIASPSGEAIHAALHPAAGESLYFVAKGDGSHYFSATLEEHNKAVRQYQLKKTRH